MALVAAACAPDPASPPATTAPVGAGDFETTIARLEKADPQSPEALNARLEYADFLSDAPSDSSSNPAGGDCRKRLDAAQAELDILAARPAVRVLLLLGPARLANTAYKIHAARADCDTANRPEDRKSELQQALEAARRGVTLYREAMDYQSAAVMQFNAAVVEHDLGDEAAAIDALKDAIAMDREFGFRDDAEDNERLLLGWTKAADVEAGVAAAMKDFPAPTLAFKFDWSGRQADVAITADDLSLVDGKPVASHGTIGLTRKIDGVTREWMVTNIPGFAQYQLGDWPAGAKSGEWLMFYFLASALMQAPSITVAHGGDFDAVTDAKKFGSQLAARVSTRMDQIPSQSDLATVNATERDMKAAFSPEFVEASAALDYGIETGAWVGAKLTQGVWYQMTTPLFLPALGLGHYMVNQDITFAFTRQVPCTADAPSRLCAEIVLRATPKAEDLKQAIGQMSAQVKLSASQSMHYWAQTYIRLVVDPATLLPHVRDVRQSWFCKINGALDPKSSAIIEQMRTVSTVSYH